MKFDYEFYTSVLEPKEGYSAWIREACNEKAERESNEEYLKALKKEHQEQIKKIDEKIKSRKELPETVKKILQQGYESFKHNDRIMTEDKPNLIWIEGQIIPKLKPIHCRLDKKEILTIFQDHVREGKALINV